MCLRIFYIQLRLLLSEYFSFYYSHHHHHQPQGLGSILNLFRDLHLSFSPVYIPLLAMESLHLPYFSNVHTTFVCGSLPVPTMGRCSDASLYPHPSSYREWYSPEHCSSLLPESVITLSLSVITLVSSLYIRTSTTTVLKNLIPVSYTHLDVYKRQALGCTIVNRNQNVDIRTELGGRPIVGPTKE